MDPVPIACSLDAGELGARVDQWRQLLAAVATRTDRPHPGRLEIGLSDNDRGLAQLMRLARFERECCPFFGFTFLVGASSATLAIEAPPDAAALLDGFAGLAGPAG